jgi:hypothetical protein
VNLKLFRRRKQIATGRDRGHRVREAVPLQRKNRDGNVERPQEVLRDDGEGSADREEGVGAEAEQSRRHRQQIENSKPGLERNKDEIGIEFAEIDVG